MPEKIIIGISVENKIAKADKNAVIVCGNSNYKAVFAFDSEWESYKVKTALFATENGDNGTIAVVFEGNECDIPPLTNTTIVGVGVASGDLTQGEEVELATTTPAYIGCLLSIKDLGGITKPPAPDVYDQIIALLNKYIQQGGGGSGGTDEERVREIVAEETADLDDKTDALSTEIAVINTVLEQSGLVSKYKATIEDTYTERVTADGANVLDGSKAKLKKVVGSTVACKNLVDIPFIDGTMVQQSIAVNFVQDLFVSVGELATVANSVWRFSFTKKNGEIIYVYDKELEGGGKKISATADNPIVKVAYRSDHITAGRYSKIMIEYGTTATEYQPYFTGLKSAYFGGIESTNTDGTETSTLKFPKTETPLGTTIDFENKKITNYGVEIVLTGAETFTYYGAKTTMSGNPIFYPSIYVQILPNAENRVTNAVSTDCFIPKDEREQWMSNALWIGVNNKFLYWMDILRILGFTDSWVDEENPTTEEQAMAIAKLKTKLAQRYADGNPVKIRYVSSVLQSETDLTAEQSASGNEYTAYKGGTETVLDNDGKDYGADNTLSQNYIIVTGVK